MSWKLFLPMLIAACLLGHPVRAPRLREAIPEFADPRCDYAGARDLYLTAYAYSREIPEVAMKFALSAEQELAHCAAEHAALSARIANLKAALP